MTLATLPRIDRLLVSEMTRNHPRGATDVYPVFAYLVHHPDGPILVDTGVGTDSELIEDLYAPRTTDIADCLATHGVDVVDVSALVLTHLHFDHCGQQHRFEGVPTYVQAADVEAVRLPHFTVAEWAAIPEDRLRAAAGDHVLADGVTLLATPGHTPGHQSVVIAAADTTAVIVGQCAYDGHEYADGHVEPGDVHDETWLDTARTSLDRVQALQPDEVYFSHDPRTWRPDSMER